MYLLQVKKWAVLGIYCNALWLANGVTCIWGLAPSFPLRSSFFFFSFFLLFPLADKFEYSLETKMAPGRYSVLVA